MEIAAAFTFASRDGGTDLRSSFDFRPKGVLRLVAPLLRPLIARDLPRQSASFKAFCEEQPAAPA